MMNQIANTLSVLTGTDNNVSTQFASATATDMDTSSFSVSLFEQLAQFQTASQANTSGSVDSHLLTDLRSLPFSDDVSLQKEMQSFAALFGKTPPMAKNIGQDINLDSTLTTLSGILSHLQALKSDKVELASLPSITANADQVSQGDAENIALLDQSTASKDSKAVLPSTEKKLSETDSALLALMLFAQQGLDSSSPKPQATDQVVNDSALMSNTASSVQAAKPTVIEQLSGQVLENMPKSFAKENQVSSLAISSNSGLDYFSKLHEMSVLPINPDTANIKQEAALASNGLDVLQQIMSVQHQAVMPTSETSPTPNPFKTRGDQTNAALFQVKVDNPVQADNNSKQTETNNLAAMAQIIGLSEQGPNASPVSVTLKNVAFDTTRQPTVVQSDSLLSTVTQSEPLAQSQPELNQQAPVNFTHEAKKADVKAVTNITTPAVQVSKSADLTDSVDSVDLSMVVGSQMYQGGASKSNLRDDRQNSIMANGMALTNSAKQTSGSQKAQMPVLNQSNTSVSDSQTAPLNINETNNAFASEFKHVQADKFSTDGASSGISPVSQPISNSKQVDAPVINTPVSHPDWNSDLGGKLLAMHSQNLPSAELKLNPAHLGPLSIKIDVDQNQQTTISFSTQHLEVKNAIEASIPRLQQMFGDQQLNLVSVNISQQQSEQKSQQGFFQMAGDQQNRGNSSKPEYHTGNSSNSDNVETVSGLQTGSSRGNNGVLSLFA